MKTTIKTIRLIILLVLFSSLKIFAQQSNFSGTWLIDMSKSDFSKVPAFVMHSQLILTQTQDSIIVKASGTTQNGNFYSAIAKYSLDGKTIEREIPGDKKLISAMRWSADKTKLLKDQRYISTDNPDKPFRTIKKEWSLSNDGKTLTIDQNVVADTGNYTIQAVFDEQ